LTETIYPSHILQFDLAMAKEWLSQRLSGERFVHSLGAHEKAAELAEKFQLSLEDCRRAAIAGLLHDTAKLLSPSELYGYCDEHGLEVHEIDRQTPQTLHPFVGADMVRRLLHIEDAEVLDAIRYHTTGRAGMSRVEQIVYIADKIEGNTRNPLYVQKVTANLNFRDVRSLDATMRFILDSTITFLIDKSQIIHPRTIEARNDVLARLKKLQSSKA
jgi:predicted HD superfamily hydrolase involved in NAD metabolism